MQCVEEGTASAKARRLDHGWCWKKGKGPRGHKRSWSGMSKQSGRWWGQRDDSQIIHGLLGHKERLVIWELKRVFQV